MSQRVFLVFSFEYPLAPEALFPQILKDLMTGWEMQRDILKSMMVTENIFI